MCSEQIREPVHFGREKCLQNQAFFFADHSGVIGRLAGESDIKVSEESFLAVIRKAR